MKVILDCDDPKAAHAFKGKKVFASNDCGEHGVGVIVTYVPSDDGLDLECAIGMLRRVEQRLRQAARAEGM